MELLAPAGSGASLRAAVQSGADAVYLGGSKFGARQSAENFTAVQMKEWVDYCHLYGVDVHAAVNTLIKEKEIAELAGYIAQLCEIGVDALIVQDIGAAEIIKKIAPEMTLHASTQMTVTSLEGVRYLENMGFDRVVLARELSRDEIEYICKHARAEIEVFVHGAICMCYSGQCLMSSILGGRSGNRGRCAQPCRLPYELIENDKIVGTGYILSPKDMALVNELQTLEKIGVASLKIEGRLKRAEYVSAVVGVYRKCLDEARRASSADMRELTDAFSRSGFTDGYFRAALGKNMMSHKTPSNSGENIFSEAAKKRAAQDADFRKIPVHIIGTLKLDSTLEVTFRDDDGNCAQAFGTIKSEKALHKPIGAERLEEQLTKLGQTPFVCTDAKVEAEDGITIPVKEINAVRREAANKLIELRKQRKEKKAFKFTMPKSVKRNDNEIILTAQVSTADQLRAAVESGIKEIYAPPELLGTLNNKMFGCNRIIAAASEIFSEENIETDRVLVSSPAAAYRYKDKKLYGDFRLNVFNSAAAEHFSSFERITLSPELNLHEIEELCENTGVSTEVIVYGHLPLMIMKNCPIKAMGKCQNGKNIYKLRDRKKEEFPLVCTKNCAAALLNSKPLFMADKLCDITKQKINAVRLIFTVEKFSQCGKIIDIYKRALSDGKCELTPAENTYTRGHFYRGVL